MRGSTFRRELRELFRLAAPLAAAQAGTQMMGLVDVAVLGRLGAHELAGAGMANAVYFAVSVFGMGMMLGIDPLVAQAVGAGDRGRARHVLWQGVWLSLIVSAALTVLLLAGSLALPIVGAAPDVEAHARSFLLVRTASLLPFLMFFVIRAYLQAHHVTRPMIVAMVVANILNFALDLVFVFGIEGWIPAMGVLSPAHRHPPARNALMIAAHLVWGAVTAASYRELVAARRTVFREGPAADAPDQLPSTGDDQ